MKISILIVLVSLLNMASVDQVPDGRYFDDIQGTIWLSEHIDQATILDIEHFYLSILEIELDALKISTTLWSFNETLKIESYNVETKERKLILECRYNQDKANGTLKLFVKNQELEFIYIPISTGSGVGFYKKDN